MTGELPSEASEILSEYEVVRSDSASERIADSEVLLAWPSRVTMDLLSRMKSLKMIQSLSAGVDALPLEAIPDGVSVHSNAGAYTSSVAEHAWGLLLGLAKGLQVRNRRTVPRTLRRKTLLVLGAGGIGCEVASLSRSLDMKAIAVSRSFRRPELFVERHPPGALDDVIGAADAVVIALPLTRETRGAVGYGTLMKCGPNVLVVNVGRGETVVEADLLRWLKERPESRFATDVFWKKGGKETFDTPAWELPNFGGTLHISGVPLGDSLLAPFRLGAENVKRFLETGAAANKVDMRDYL